MAPSLSIAGLIRQARLDSIRSTRRHRGLPRAIWDPRQIATQNIDSERGSHEDCAYPKAPVTMHAPPVRAGIGFASAVAVSFGVVLVSSHYFSISHKHSPLRAAPVAEVSTIQGSFGHREADLATIPLRHNYYPRAHDPESGQLWADRGLHVV